MINLANINLSSDEQILINSNLRAAISSEIEFVPIDGIYWLNRLTIYEVWLLQFLDPDTYAMIEPSYPDVANLNVTWKWDEANATVVSPRQLSTAAAFPVLSIVMMHISRPVSIVVVDPSILADANTAWYVKSCAGAQWEVIKPYVPAPIDLPAVDCSVPLKAAPSFLQKLSSVDNPIVLDMPLQPDSQIASQIASQTASQTASQASQASQAVDERSHWPIIVVIILICCLLLSRSAPRTAVAVEPVTLAKFATTADSDAFHRVIRKMNNI